MTTRRMIVWFVLFVLAVPTVAAAADALQRAQTEDTLVQIAHLREGERYTYDLHFTSEAQKIDSTAKGHLVVEVGEVSSFTRLDGATADVLPVTTRTGTPPWLSAAGEVEEVVQVQYLRVPDGQLMATEETRVTAKYVRTDEGLRKQTGDTHLIRDVQTRHSGILRDVGGPGRTYVNANEVLHTVLIVSGLARGERITETATLGGRTVYNVAGYDWTSTGGMVFCRLSSPEVTYSADLAVYDVQGTIESTHWNDVWADENHAVPVAAGCETTAYTAADGHWVDTIRMDLVLAEHLPGTSAVVFDPEDALPIPVHPPLPAEPGRLPGLPRQGDISLLFPLEEAVDLLLTTTELKRFRETGEAPFLVAGFGHTPATPTRRGTAYDPAEQLPDPLGLVPPEAHGGRPKTDAVWWFTLQNLSGAQRLVTVDRAFDAEGNVVDEEVTVERKDDWELLPSDFPDRLVPLSGLIGQHAQMEGMTVDDWMQEAGSQVHASTALSTHTVDEVVTRELRMSLSFDGPGEVPAPEDGWSSKSRNYDMETGTPMSKSTHMSRFEGVEGRPAAVAPAAVEGPRVVPLTHVPAAAAASGLAVALAFAAAYFWDGITRVFGQAVAAPMYAKVRKDKVLDHRTRDRIVDYVAANPGAALGAVRQELGAGYGTTVHHLNTLEQNGLLVSRKVGRQRCWFPAGAMAPTEMDATAAGQTSAARRFLELIEKEPGLSQQEIAARLGVADASVRYQAKRLLAHERVRAERQGRSVRYYPVAKELVI